jgi:hypothetical protein
MASNGGVAVQEGKRWQRRLKSFAEDATDRPAVVPYLGDGAPAPIGVGTSASCIIGRTRDASQIDLEEWHGECRFAMTGDSGRYAT